MATKKKVAKKKTAAVKKKPGKPGRKPGSPKPPGSGRKKGTPNKVTAEAREAARKIVDDPEYRHNLWLRACAGDLPSAVECMLHYYAYGKPVEKVEVGGEVSIARLVLGTQRRGMVEPRGPVAHVAAPALPPKGRRK